MQYFKKGITRALKHGSLPIFALANWFNTFETCFQRVGMGWLTWQLTHSRFLLGAVAFAEFIIGAITSYIGLRTTVASSPIICLICILIKLAKRKELTAKMELIQTAYLKTTSISKIKLI